MNNIALGHKYGITDWLAGAYEAVYMREELLNIEEGMKIDLKNVIKITASQQVYGIGKAHYESKYLAGRSSSSAPHLRIKK